MKPRGLLLLAFAVALYLLGTVIWVGAERRSSRQFLSPGSAWNEGERGASLARAYLGSRPGRSTGLLNRPIAVAELPADAVVFRLEPREIPWQARVEKAKKREKPRKAGKKPVAPSSDDDAEEEEEIPSLDPHPGRFAPLLSSDEEEWVRGGGRLVLALAGSYGSLWTEREKGRDRLEKVFPLWPGVRDLRPPVRRALRGPALAGAQTVVLAGESPVIARLPLGAGDVILLACPEIFENSRLAVADHLALLEALTGDRRPVLFDEAAHGLVSTSGPFDLLARWGLGPALLLAGLAGLAGFSRQALRVGPPERDDPDARSEAVDLVDSLGELYDRALSRADAIRLYWEGFVHAVGVDTGLSGAALLARARELAAGFAPPAPGEELSREGFLGALARLNDSRRTTKRRVRDGEHDRP